VLGIDASAKPVETRDAVLRIARATASLVELGTEIAADDVLLDPRYAGTTYGIPTPETLDAIRLAARLEGMITDPVYEGKSMAALIGLVQSGEIPRDAKVLYVHLGGAPAINAYSALFR
jgi:1-aminocyclopropane-1-carboxylate deaminase